MRPCSAVSVCAAEPYAIRTIRPLFVQPTSKPSGFDRTLPQWLIGHPYGSQRNGSLSDVGDGLRTCRRFMIPYSPKADAQRNTVSRGVEDAAPYDAAIFPFS